MSSPEKNAIRAVAGTAVPVRGDDIDTDQIIPARYMKVVTFDGLGEFAFYDARRDAGGSANNHPFNDRRYSGASILIVNRNFGCGSSREHAPQALLHAGVRAIIGESFAEIFAGNCNALGIVAATADPASVAALQEAVAADPTTQITVDIEAMTATAAEVAYELAMPDTYRRALVDGQWDSTAILLANDSAIEQTASRLPYITGFTA